MTKWGGLKQNVTSSFHRQDSSGVVFYSFGLVTKSWAELRFGLGYGASVEGLGYVEGGMSIGLETNDIPLRGDAYMFWLAQNKRWKALIDIERGGSGWWHLGFLQYKAADNFWIGLRAQKFYVTGVMASWSIPKTPLTIWGAGGYAPQSDGDPLAGMFGISCKFQN